MNVKLLGCVWGDLRNGYSVEYAYQIFKFKTVLERSYRDRMVFSKCEINVEEMLRRIRLLSFMYLAPTIQYVSRFGN